MKIKAAVMRFLFLVTTAMVGCSGSTVDTEWTVMSWNVQNLFDGEDDGTEYREFDPGTDNWDQRLYERRLDRTVEVLNSSFSGGADLVILQELEKPEILDDLVERGLLNQGYDWRLAVDGYGIIRCGILSRYRIYNVMVVDSGFYGNRSLRPAVVFYVDTPFGEVRVAAVHWKSPRGGREETEEARVQEAMLIRDLIYADIAANPSFKFLVIGDLNTDGDAAVLPAALGPWEPDFVDEVVLFRTPRMEEAGFHSDSLVLFDPEPTGNPPGTYWFRGAWGRPDRALLTPGLLEGTGLRFDSFRIEGLEVMGDRFGGPMRWRTDFEEGYSDHFPISLTFRNVDSTETNSRSLPTESHRREP